MIRSLADKRTESVFNGVGDKSLPTSVVGRARAKLDQIDYATGVNDLRVPPGNRLEQLRGDRVGQYSIRVNRNWRLCFGWKMVMHSMWS